MIPSQHSKCQIRMINHWCNLILLIVSDRYKIDYIDTNKLYTPLSLVDQLSPKIHRGLISSSYKITGKPN